MATKKVFSLKFRRRREGKTNYKTRLKLLMNRKHRLVIRKTDRNITAQIVDYAPKGDKVLVAVSSSHLKKMGWSFSGKNIPAAYLLGLLIGTKAKAAKITDAIVDMGLHPAIKGSRLFAVVKGALDAGLKIPVNEEIFPPDERISGKHISDYKKSDKITKEFETLRSKLKGK